MEEHSKRSYVEKVRKRMTCLLWIKVNTWRNGSLSNTIGVFLRYDPGGWEPRKTLVSVRWGLQCQRGGRQQATLHCPAKSERNWPMLQARAIPRLGSQLVSVCQSPLLYWILTPLLAHSHAEPQEQMLWMSNWGHGPCSSAFAYIWNVIILCSNLKQTVAF